MLTFRDDSDREFLRTLQKLQPVTVRELCEVLDVTATAVRQKLTRMQAEGLIWREVSRQERGRPRHDYRLTATAVKYLGDDHAEIAAILWQEIMRIPDAVVRLTLLRSIRESLITRFGTSAPEGSVASRLAEMCAKLGTHGFDIDFDLQTETGQLPILREHNCPYHEIASTDKSICELEQSVFSALLGVPVELSSCRLDGHRCCEFQVGGMNGNRTSFETLSP